MDCQASRTNVSLAEAATLEWPPKNSIRLAWRGWLSRDLWLSKKVMLFERNWVAKHQERQRLQPESNVPTRHHRH